MGNALSYRPGQIQDEPLGAVGGGLSDVFAPGGWDQRQYSQTPAQPAPQKKSWGNALGSFVQNTLKAAAPEAYQQGVTDRMNSQISNALASGNVSGAAQAAYGANDWQTGMQLGEYGQQQEAAQRQQEAQGVLNLFQSAQPAQIAEMAMTDPVGFERMTGMTADEYTQAGQRMVQAGLSPEQFHQYVIQKAQAELGMEPAGPMEINNQLVDPNTLEVLGDYRTPEAPNTPDYVREEFSDGIYEWIPGQPDTFRKVGDAPMDATGAGDGRVEYGVTPVYGFDKDGNRIILQTSKTGDLGVPELPEGVTLESPYDRSYGQTAGRERAKKDAYQTAEGLKVQAAEEDFSRYSSQIDRAIELSTTGNTGIFGQFKPSPDLNAILDTIEAGTAFKTLVDLKSQGGTLGALSDTELQLLKAKIASVRRSQSRDQLHANLEILKLSMANSLGRLKQAYETEYAAGRYDRPAPNGQAATGGAAPRGAVGPSGQPVPEGFE
jgi:hypothetical protein